MVSSMGKCLFIVNVDFVDSNSSFAIRGDPRKREIQYAKESAFFLALQWFEEHLKGR